MAKVFVERRKTKRWVIRSYVTAACSFCVVCIAVISRGW